MNGKYATKCFYLLSFMEITFGSSLELLEEGSLHHIFIMQTDSCAVTSEMTSNLFSHYNLSIVLLKNKKKNKQILFKILNIFSKIVSANKKGNIIGIKHRIASVDITLFLTELLILVLSTA